MKNLDRSLLCVLGLSPESAEIVISEIERLRVEALQLKRELTRQNELTRGWFDRYASIYSATKTLTKGQLSEEVCNVYAQWAVEVDEAYREDAPNAPIQRAP